MDLAEQLAMHMDDLACEGTRPVEVFCRLIRWGETTIQRKGLLFRIDVMRVCERWWQDRLPAESDRLRAPWATLGNAITDLLRNVTPECSK